MNRFSQKVFIVLFSLTVLTFSLYLLLSDTRAYSDVENRNLQQVPTLSVDTIKNGQFMEDLEQFVVDQFPGRDQFLKGYLDYQLLTNKTFIYDYYLAEDDWILPKPKIGFDEQAVDKAAATFNQFAHVMKDKGISVFYANLPHKASMFNFLYPDSFDLDRQLELTQTFFDQLDEDAIHTVNMTDYFLRQDQPLEKLYFKTDHHWNMNGAFLGYQYLLTELTKQLPDFTLDAKLLEQDYYDTLTLTDRTFRGSYNRQLYMEVDSEDDNKQMFTLVTDQMKDFNVTVNGDTMDHPFDVYGRAFFDDTTDLVSYSYLYTSDLGNVSIHNPHADNDDHLFVLKDSYTNALTLLLAQHFKQVTFFDYRYSTTSLKDTLQETDVDLLLVSYNNANVEGDAYEVMAFN